MLFFRTLYTKGGEVIENKYKQEVYCRFLFSVMLLQSAFLTGGDAFGDVYPEGLETEDLVTEDGWRYTLESGKCVITRYELEPEGTLTVPASLTIDGASVAVYAIGSSAFCEQGFSSAVISSGISMIEDGAFSFCSSLADVSIPESVTVIGTDAFYSCSNLKSVTLSSAVTSIGSHAFGYYMTDNAEYAGIPGFEVKGYAGTAAQQYANSNGFTFTDLTPQKEPETETPTAAKTNISAASVSGVMDKTYTGAALEQSFTVKVGTAALTKGTDYSVSYSGNVKAGSGYVTVIGKGNFCGSKRIKFSIARANIRKASIKGLQASYPYTGKAVRPKITVRMNGKDLNKGNEYTLKYKNNSKPGNASVIIKGKKNYTGTKLLYFRILKPSIKYRVYTKEEKESNYVKNGSIAGKDKINATVESFEAQLTTAPCKGKIKYKSYVSEQGWGKWKDGGKWCGGKDKSLQIEAIQMILTDTMAKKYDIYYRVRTEKFGWMGWAKNGNSSGSEGYNSPIQAIEIQVVLKGHEKPVVYPLGGHKNAFEYKAP